MSIKAARKFIGENPLISKEHGLDDLLAQIESAQVVLNRLVAGSVKQDDTESICLFCHAINNERVSQQHNADCPVLAAKQWLFDNEEWAFF